MTGPGRPGRENQASLTAMAAAAVGWTYPTLLQKMLATACTLEKLRMLQPEFGYMGSSEKVWLWRRRQLMQTSFLALFTETTSVTGATPLHVMQTPSRHNLSQRMRYQIPSRYIALSILLGVSDQTEDEEKRKF